MYSSRHRRSNLWLAQLYLHPIEDNSDLDLVIGQAVEDVELVDQDAASDCKVHQGKRHGALDTDLSDLICCASCDAPRMAERRKCVAPDRLCNIKAQLEGVQSASCNTPAVGSKACACYRPGR